MHIVLDPRISYDVLKDDYSDDWDLADHLEKSKDRLQHYYDTLYASSAPVDVPSFSTPSSQEPGSPSKVNFTARYRKKSRTTKNELEDYFKLQQEDFDSCDPIQWWYARREQFPNLYRLARDIFSIPGKPFYESVSILSISNIILFLSIRFRRRRRANLLWW